MDQSLPLISTLVIAFSLALVFGFLAERFLKAPALVGYLLAGIAAGQYTPGVYADPALAHQLSEIGVMLLMFGVGLQFSIKDLLAVKNIAVPGATLQMCIATILGGTATHFIWGWNWGPSLVLGLCLSCASTVVLIKACEVRGILRTMDGQIAVGWLVVEDIATVLILVLLPVVANLTGVGSDTVITAKDVCWKIGLTIFNVSAFLILIMVVGKRVFPRLLSEVARTGSRELFTLFILALAVGIAYGASIFFNVSFALGAFFAGTMMRESSFARRAAHETLPLQDAFSVLFFVGVGMLFDWHILVDAPFQVLTILMIIMLGKSAAAFGLVHSLKYPLHTSLTVSAALAQIGEFSFLLVLQAQNVGLANEYMVNLIVGAAILSIALNPVVFSLVPSIKRRLIYRFDWAKKADLVQAPFEILPEETEQKRLKDQIVVIGDTRLTIPLMHNLQKRNLPAIAVVQSHEIADWLNKYDISVLVGTPTDPKTLVSAHVMTAKQLIILNNTTDSLRIVEIAKTLNEKLHISIVGTDPGAWLEIADFSDVTFMDTRRAAAMLLAKDIDVALKEDKPAGLSIQRRQRKRSISKKQKEDQEPAPFDRESNDSEETLENDPNPAAS